MPDISVMLKPASGLCNMRCRYCFYHDETENRERGDYGIMSRETARNVIKHALAFADGGAVYFAFQGGEPLLAGKDFYRFFVDETRKNNGKHSIITFAMQTNGTLIDEEWALLFKQYDFLVGVSLDGGQDTNLYRTDKELNPTFRQARNGIELLRKNAVAFNILTVITRYAAAHIEELYRYLKGEGFRNLQFIPCLRPLSGEKSELCMDEKEYADYLIRAFNLYVKDYVSGDYVSVRYFDNLVSLYLGKNPEQCGINGHCSHQFVIEGNGDVFPCDFYCLDEWKIGSVNTDDFAKAAKCEKAENFIKKSLQYPTKCRSCAIGYMCRAGGCMRMREDCDYCSSYQAFYRAVMPLFRVFDRRR